MKKYIVSLLKEGTEIQFDSLPVAKITHYPLEKGDYKPYAQGVLCITEEQIGLRLFTFEVSPEKTSKIGLVLYPYSDKPEKFFEIWCTPDQVKGVSDKGKSIQLDFHQKNGEDLQGIYWGYDIFVSRKDLASEGKLACVAGQKLKGNFFKIQEEKKSHFGAFDLADFKERNEYHNEKMAAFELAWY